MLSTFILLAVLGIVLFMTVFTIVIWRLVKFVLSRLFAARPAQQVVRKVTHDVMQQTANTLNVISNITKDE